MSARSTGDDADPLSVGGPWLPSSRRAGALLNRVRRPEYTGRNRCWPCTLANATIVLALAGAAVVVIHPVASVAILLGGVVAIWLRGYLVPFTPTATAAVHSWLASDPDRIAEARIPEIDAESTVAGEESEVDVDIVDELVDRGVLLTVDGRLALSPTFRDAWRAEIADVRTTSDEDLAAILASELPQFARARIVDDGDRWIVLTDAEDTLATETWLSRHVAVADLAAMWALGDVLDADVERRALAATPLRQFLERCPICDATLERSEGGGCCGSPRHVGGEVVTVLGCPACDTAVTSLGAG